MREMLTGTGRCHAGEGRCGGFSLVETDESVGIRGFSGAGEREGGEGADVGEEGVREEGDASAREARKFSLESRTEREVARVDGER